MCICGRHTVARPDGDLSSISDYRDRDTTSGICPIIGDAPAMCGCEHIHTVDANATLPRIQLPSYYFVRPAVAMKTSPLGRRQKQKQSALNERAAEVVSIDVHLSRLRSARSTLSGLRRIQGHGDGCSDYCSPSSATNHDPKVLQLTHPRPAGLNCCAAAEAYWALDSRPSTIFINLWHELLPCFAELNGEQQLEPRGWRIGSQMLPLCRCHDT